jgi:hypothetical protein
MQWPAAVRTEQSECLALFGESIGGLSLHFFCLSTARKCALMVYEERDQSLNFWRLRDVVIEERIKLSSVFGSFLGNFGFDFEEFVILGIKSMEILVW